MNIDIQTQIGGDGEYISLYIGPESVSITVKGQHYSGSTSLTDDKLDELIQRLQQIQVLKKPIENNH